MNVWNGYQDMFVLTLPGSSRDKNSKGLKSNFSPNIKLAVLGYFTIVTALKTFYFRILNFLMKNDICIQKNAHTISIQIKFLQN